MAWLVWDYFWYPTESWKPPGTYNKGTNGLWLRYWWYFGKRTPAEFAAMAELLKREQIKFAYFHVRELKKDGSLVYHYKDSARKLVDYVHEHAPGVKVIPWILANSYEVDLESAAVRDKMIAEAKWLVNECGFDGIQWDYEYVRVGSNALPELLDATRRALPPGTHISVDAPIWCPPSPVCWTEDYYSEVAKHCDQICVMGYDTCLMFPRAYAWLMSQQAIRTTRAVAAGNPACHIILGVPTYDNTTRSHHPYTESLLTALRGTYAGLADKDTKLEVFDGVAPFADYTTDENEWRIYEKYWLQR